MTRPFVRLPNNSTDTGQVIRGENSGKEGSDMNTEIVLEQQDIEATVKPRWCVLKNDETANWCEDIVGRAKRIYGVYLFDRNAHVHCAEFTPSYECYFVESQFENSDLPDREAD